VSEGGRHKCLQNLKLIQDRTPQDKELDRIVDNYATDERAGVGAWLKRHPGFLTPSLRGKNLSLENLKPGEKKPSPPNSADAVW
jgi:hypothetical protein